jgi:hypothetical protein
MSDDTYDELCGYADRQADHYVSLTGDSDGWSEVFNQVFDRLADQLTVELVADYV